eukprot:gnl/MRDRNA2_/MRDRNA2_16500_c0_seq1.p1 gnl/MRDRNA2_/MRDRNA2_16500_c0~~gnl/MRDRNA2_/MRDRNA2_16500_c0_seq1.p1  ORF type:complete len:283 (+),score=61.69 gnl/MRDRNA2_/MRDRNA2_16500_c0_seq1:38-850(+)
MPDAEREAIDAAKRKILIKHVRDVLEENTEHKILVFVNTKAFADELSNQFWEDGFKSDAMHGGRPQQTRLNVLESFRGGKTKLLVTTDVFARGIDIPAVSHVIIFEMGSIEDYVHRIGRTARGVNQTGHALVFFEYWWGAPQCAKELIGVLERSKQVVPQALRKIAEDVAAGRRQRRGEEKWSSWAPNKRSGEDYGRRAQNGQNEDVDYGRRAENGQKEEKWSSWTPNSKSGGYWAGSQKNNAVEVRQVASPSNDVPDSWENSGGSDGWD